MGARGDFRDHAGIGRVRLVLAPDYVSEDFRLAANNAHDRRRGFIAACFDAEDWAEIGFVVHGRA